MGEHREVIVNRRCCGDGQARLEPEMDEGHRAKPLVRDKTPHYSSIERHDHDSR